MNICAEIDITGAASAAAGAAFPTGKSGSQRLEERQRDLEQEIADLADVIKHLKSGETPAGATLRSRAFGAPLSRGAFRPFPVAILATPHFTGLAKWARGAHFL